MVGKVFGLLLSLSGKSCNQDVSYENTQMLVRRALQLFSVDSIFCPCDGVQRRQKVGRKTSTSSFFA